MNNCPKKQCLISFLAVFAFIFIYEKLFHGCPWMMDMYQKTAALWRSPAEMQQLFPWFFVRDGLLAAVICCLYKRWSAGPCCCMSMKSGSCGTKPEGSASACGTKKPCPHMCGMCFGFKIGIIMGALSASAYIWMPIPGALAAAWFFGSLIEGALIGLMLSFLCKKKECTPA